MAHWRHTARQLATTQPPSPLAETTTVPAALCRRHTPSHLWINGNFGGDVCRYCAAELDTHYNTNNINVLNSYAHGLTI